jgi:uncharacterized protein YkwD
MTRRALFQAAFSATLPLRGQPGDFARRIFVRANELRVARGAGELKWSEPLARCALEQCERREALRFAGHVDPERGGVAERLEAAGIRWATCAENLFKMRGYDDPANFAIVFWWYSLGHQANMVNPAFTDTGVAVTQGADGTFFVTQIFTLPAPPGVRLRR